MFYSLSYGSWAALKPTVEGKGDALGPNAVNGVLNTGPKDSRGRLDGLVAHTPT